MDRVITLTPAPALDITITADSLSAGVSHRIAPATYRLGGKGVNVANILAQQGFKATAMGLVSQQDQHAFGGTGYPDARCVSELHPQLERRFTDTALPLRSTWSIYSERDADTAMFNEPARQFPQPELDQLSSDVRGTAASEPGAVVAISGSVPRNIAPHHVASLCSQLKESGSEVIVDTQGPTLLECCAARPAWVKPNVHELEEALGFADPVAGSRELQRLGAENVAVSMGKEGLLLATPEGFMLARLLRPVAGNPTGAGDAVVAALAASRIDGWGLEETARTCVAWSAAAVLSPVAGEISPRCDELFDQVIIESSRATRGPQ